ncbi:unnamed protein product [Hermetia illucens]|uniref:Nbr1 FW domain-containing protein n=1 Tax=Hermetia illucens TaxID=343691 RepID=A0A7R8V1I0_HERIL|nr:protein ILRUN [Hermetia illucens]CAD7090510.1 unnamed protein product [Hermetia illucens]
MDISESPDPQPHGQQQQTPQPVFGPENFQRPPQPSHILDEAMDGRPVPQLDIDSNLLQQFSCLGTTDHEDLIDNFQRLLDNQLSKETARFFLEMSNWNLQTAVCCYLDFCNFQNLPSMKIVSQSRPTGQSQAWRLQNDGTEEWPAGCYLMSPSQTKRLEVPVVRPGESFDIVADIPPSSPAIMWRLCTPNGWYFGEKIWMLPPTIDDTADLAERMAQLRTTASMSPENSPQVNIVIIVKMD